MTAAHPHAGAPTHRTQTSGGSRRNYTQRALYDLDAPLALRLGISPADVRTPKLEFAAFVNDAVNECIEREMDYDYLNYRSRCEFLYRLRRELVDERRNRARHAKVALPDVETLDLENDELLERITDPDHNTFSFLGALSFQFGNSCITSTYA